MSMTNGVAYYSKGDIGSKFYNIGNRAFLFRQIIYCHSKSQIANRKSQMAKRKSQIRNHKLQIVNRKSQITNCKLQIANRKSKIANRKIANRKITNCKIAKLLNAILQIAKTQKLGHFTL